MWSLFRSGGARYSHWCSKRDVVRSDGSAAEEMGAQLPPTEQRLIIVANHGGGSVLLRDVPEGDHMEDIRPTDEASSTRLHSSWTLATSATELSSTS
ncbi:MAG: hypothetical protein MJE77_27430 [Proteobacteria bacterium]|nr:hypothetical protein [Pseudomonadota bacterium]